MRRWARYVPVAERRAKANKHLQKLEKQGQTIEPVEIQGRTICRSFWGKGWKDHLESFSDFANRLPRGRTYVRNGSVCHLTVSPGLIGAFVSGSSLYHVGITIKPLPAKQWEDIKKACSGQIGSMLELLQGRLSDHVMTVVTDLTNGLFPKPGEIKFSCSCPDSAIMCKHVAAVLYGVANRLDNQPALLFVLRGVDPQELIAEEFALPTAGEAAGDDVLDDGELSGIFGIDLEDGDAQPEAPPEPKPKAKASNGRKTAAKAAAKGKQSPRKAAGTPDKPPAKAGKKLTQKPGKTPPAPIHEGGGFTGERIKALRKELGLTGPEFAARLKVSTNSVYRWEKVSGPVKLHSRIRKALERLQRSAHKSR